MEDIRRQDVRLFWRELGRPFRIVQTLLVAGIGSRLFPWPVVTLLSLGAAAYWVYRSWKDSVAKRFANRRYEVLWLAAQERLARFEEVLVRMRKEQVADLSEMPKTIRATGTAVYVALRRADMVVSEVQRSERGLMGKPPIAEQLSSDPQARELYRIADKNIAEYRQHLDGVMASVHRTEAQAAVYTTTLDALRVRMLGHRLVGRNAEVPSQEFLEAMTEAKMQLDAIDKALEEIELTPFPMTIAVIPQSVPNDHVEQASGEPK